MSAAGIGGMSISIHAPREGSDSQTSREQRKIQEISIHAPREGSDFAVALYGVTETYFNPRSP